MEHPLTGISDVLLLVSVLSSCYFSFSFSSGLFGVNVVSISVCWLHGAQPRTHEEKRW